MTGESATGESATGESATGESVTMTIDDESPHRQRIAVISVVEAVR